MNQRQQFPFFVKPVSVRCASNKSSIDKYPGNGSFPSHLVKRILKLVAIFQHIQLHSLVVDIHVMENLLGHGTVRAGCF